MCPQKNNFLRAQPLDGNNHLWPISHEKSRKKCSFTPCKPCPSMLLTGIRFFALFFVRDWLKDNCFLAHPSRKLLNFLLLFGSLLLVWHSSFALPTDKDQIVRFKADRVLYNRTTGIGIYTGHVQVIQGTTVINANQIITYSNQQNEVQKAIATGSPAQYQTQPKLNQAIMHANANVIEYYPQKRLVILKGKANVTQEKNILTSPWIAYDMKLDRVKTGTDNTKERTTIIFQPQSVSSNSRSKQTS